MWLSDDPQFHGMKTNAPLIGKKVGGFLYIHRSARGALPEREAQLLARAEEIASDGTWNVAKISSGTVSLLVYQDFDASAFPALISALTVNLTNGCD